MDAHTETIAAIATAWGEAGVGIVRLSGPRAEEILRRILVLRPPTLPEATVLEDRHLYHGYVRDPESLGIVDEVLAAVMRAPASYTGEDVVEIQGHGGALVVATVLSLVLGQGARLARRGEFTLRAFLNGRLDLTQAEAVLDLVQARSRGGLDLALGQLQGRLSARVQKWRDQLRNLLSHLEACTDFPEDEVPALPRFELEAAIGAIQAGVEEMLARSHAGRIYREGVRVAIAGPPNAGKSSLLNALLREPRALVTPLPGTTRDSIEEWAALGGIPFLLADTAGLRSPADLVESLGVERARRLIEQSDLVLLVLDGADPPDGAGLDFLSRVVEGRRGILVVNKQDLALRLDYAALPPALAGWPRLECCLLAAGGQDSAPVPEELEQKLVEEATGSQAPPLGELSLCNLRHIRALEEAVQYLAAALETVRAGRPADLAAIDLAAALGIMGGITGQQVTQDVLDGIFEQFCVGK